MAPIMVQMVNGIANFAMSLPSSFQNGLATMFLPISFRSAKKEANIWKAGTDNCPNMYPDNARNGIAISMTARRIGAVNMLMNDIVLKRFSP